MSPSRYQLSMGSRPVTSTHLWDEHGWKSYRSNIAETVNVVTKIVTPELPNRNPWYVAFAGNIICFGNPFLNTLYKGMRGHRGAGGSFRPAETNIWQSFVGIIPQKKRNVLFRWGSCHATGSYRPHPNCGHVPGPTLELESCRLLFSRMFGTPSPLWNKQTNPKSTILALMAWCKYNMMKRTVAVPIQALISGEHAVKGCNGFAHSPNT